MWPNKEADEARSTSELRSLTPVLCGQQRIDDVSHGAHAPCCARGFGWGSQLNITQGASPIPIALQAVAKSMAALSLWNGSPGERVGVVVANRILGVTGRGENSLPPYLARQLSGTHRELYGDFRVCTLFDPPREGHMESVCVHTWRNLVLQELPANARPLLKRIPPAPAPPWPTD